MALEDNLKTEEKEQIKTVTKTKNSWFFKYTNMVKEYAPESTAMSMTFLPIYSVAETMFAGMSDLESISARGLSILGSYLAIPPIILGRNKIVEKMKQKGNSKKSRTWAERVYGGLITLGIKAIGYRVVTSNPSEIILGTASSVAIAGYISPALFRLTDTFKHLLTGKEYDNTPEWLLSKSKSFKKNLAIGYTATMLSLSGMAYSLPNSGFDLKELKFDIKEWVTKTDQAMTKFAPYFIYNGR